jgi:hypothetical protein
MFWDKGIWNQGQIKIYVHDNILSQRISHPTQMSASYLERAIVTLNKHRITILHQQNALVLKSAPMTSRVISFINNDITFPVVAHVNFPLDSCQFGGKGEESKLGFLPHRPNVCTVRTPYRFDSVDDWSMCILHGAGEVVGICPSDSGIQITYVVTTAFPIPDTIYVSIHYRGISIFPEPVEIDREIFENSGRLVFRAILSGILNHGFIISMSPDGSAIAFYYPADMKTRVYEIVGGGMECGDIVYRLTARLKTINYYDRQRFTGTSTIIGLTDKNQLAEVSFDDRVLRTFPFTNPYSFDICQASDCMIVSFRDRKDIVLAKLSTGETLRAIPYEQSCADILISLSGQFISVFDFGRLKIYSFITGTLIKEIQFKGTMVKFLSDETIMVYDAITRKMITANILTGKTREFLLDERHFTPFIQGSYAYCIQDGILCAYE